VKKAKLNLRDRIKSKITLRSLLYATICSGIFLGLYFAFALFYPFALYYPHSLLAFALAIIYFPIFLSTEIFYRKAIFPTLDFIKSRKNRTYFISIIIFCVQVFLLFQLGLLYQSYLLVAGCAFLFSSLMNSIIYHKTEHFGAVLLNSFIICGIFFGAVWSFYLNLIAIII
jgi:hypothetical protein